MKTATIQARIAPKLKKDVEVILAKLGLSASDAIAMYYSQIKHHQGIPFDVRVPKKSVQKAMRDIDLGRNLTKADNLDELIAQLSSKH